MSEKALSQPTLDLINKYLNLEIAGKKIQAPYFNNKRSKVRGGLRVLIGKGSPADLITETELLALREKIELKNLNEDQIKKFMVDHNLGIDCSGLAYYILDTEFKSKNKGSLSKYIKRPWIKNPLRKLIAKIRTVENTGVSTFNNEKNSKEIKLKDIQPGDMIIMMNTGKNNDIHHVLIVQSILRRSENTERREDLSKSINNDLQKFDVIHNSDTPKDPSSSSAKATDSLGMTIVYTHSFKYPEDGQYKHGIKQEKIEITNPNKSLLEQNWNESRMLEHARQAKELKIKRLK